MGKHTVIGLAVMIEVFHVGLHIADGKGFIVAIELVDAIEALSHGSIFLPAGTTDKYQQ
jgi:hypothetical protein